MELINKFIICFLMSLLSTYSVIRVMNYKIKDVKTTKTLFFLCLCIIISFGRAILVNYLSLISGIIIYIFSINLVLSFLLKYKFENLIYATTISFAITYSFYTFSAFLASLIVYLIFQRVYTGILLIAITIIFTTILTYYLFKIRRLENGILFFQRLDTSKNFSVLGIILSGFILIAYSSLHNFELQTNQFVFIGCIIITIGLFIWIKRSLKLFYKELIKEDTIIEMHAELEQNNKEKEELIQELKTLAEVNHKYSHKISLLEYQLKKLCYSLDNNNVEFSKELSDINKLIENLSNEFVSEMNNRIKINNKLPKTKILEIDKMIEYMLSECEKNNINFNFKIKHSINYLIRTYITAGKLQTLLADHIKDSIIAIKNSDGNNHKIMVTFDIVNNSYELRISDTGIPFQISTLVKLGLEPITTHKETGGTGYGYITTFKTLEETKASIIIEEYEKGTYTYSKTVIFRFDNNKDYKIRSYRSDKIDSLCNDNRITIEKI